LERPYKYSITYETKDPQGKTLGSNEGKARLDERTLTFQPTLGKSREIPYFEVMEIIEGDYKITLKLGLGEEVVMTQLGYEYENFLNNLYRLRGELLLRYMLMDEGCIATNIEANYQYVDPNGRRQEGACEVRVYESAVVVLPDKADPIRIPLCYLKSSLREGYAYSLSADVGEVLTLSQMGEKTDFFERSLSNALAGVETRSQGLLSALKLGVDPAVVRRGAMLLGDGKAASGEEMQTISIQLWKGLEEKLRVVGIGDEYDYLKALSNPGEMRIGIKRGLMGDRTGEYVWFMAPIYSSDPSLPGNAVVLEAASDEASGRATYLFRIMDRRDYKTGVLKAQLEDRVGSFLHLVNRCLIEINFRREPIYLTEERLMEPEYERYLYAAKRLAGLRVLRDNFIGRVAHSSQEKWRSEISAILKFNVESVNNLEKWEKQ
jgi:hypothetical protein